MSSSQERTEEATPKRRERARAEGDQPKSVLATYAAALWFSAAVYAVAPRAAEFWVEAFTRCASDAANAGRFAGSTAEAAGVGRSVDAWLPAGVAWICACAASIASAAACGAIGWSPGALRWRAARLSPLAGLRSLVARESLVQTGVTLCAAVSLLACAIPGTRLAWAGARALAPAREEAVLAQSAVVAFWWRAALAVSALAVIDVALVRRRHAASLRMTPREVRDERAEQEGRPEVKARRRSVALRRSRRLRVSALKRAAAVVTNPTHVAVALQYSPPHVDVPTVIAIGADGAATIVRTAAAFYDVPIVESPDLARALFARVDVDEAIPEELYAGVAAVFAWILKRRGRLGPRDSS